MAAIPIGSHFGSNARYLIPSLIFLNEYYYYENFSLTPLLSYLGLNNSDYHKSLYTSVYNPFIAYVFNIPVFLTSPYLLSTFSQPTKPLKLFTKATQLRPQQARLLQRKSRKNLRARALPRSDLNFLRRPSDLQILTRAQKKTLVGLWLGYFECSLMPWSQMFNIETRIWKSSSVYSCYDFG